MESGNPTPDRGTARLETTAARALSAGVAQPRNPAGTAAMPAYFFRLSARAQRCYLMSDSIERYQFALSENAAARTAALIGALKAGPPGSVQSAACALSAELCRVAGVRPVAIDVMGVRPHNTRGELHGIFYVAPPGRIVLWMRTAKRHDVVKPRTFVRTLFHELGHYFDYALLHLGDSFHTRGFFKRESFLMRALCEPGPE